MNNPLQQRTGQVAPGTQNPQQVSLQPYQQSTEQLQNTSSQLLETSAGLKISVPSTNSKTSTTTVASPVISPASTNSYGTILILGVLVALSLAIFMILLSRILTSKNSEKPSEFLPIEPEPQPTLEVVTEQPRQVTPAKPKKKKRKKKRK